MDMGIDEVKDVCYILLYPSHAALSRANTSIWDNPTK